MERGLGLDNHLYIVPCIDDVMIITSLVVKFPTHQYTVRGLLKTLGKFNAQLNL